MHRGNFFDSLHDKTEVKVEAPCFKCLYLSGALKLLKILVLIAFKGNRSAANRQNIPVMVLSLLDPVSIQGLYKKSSRFRPIKTYLIGFWKLSFK